MAMTQAGIALIAGLGNPGSRYAATRHNAGFLFVERLQELLGFRLAGEKRFHGETGSVSVRDRMVRVITPDTMMNLSGRAVAPMADFYRIAPEQILVIHDELDLAPGDARLKLSGGHGGHNGLRDLITHLGSRDFLRLRIGIGHPGAAHEVSGYVLNKPDAHDRRCIEDAIDRSLEVIEEVIAGNFATAMERLHGEAKSVDKNARGMEI